MKSYGFVGDLLIRNGVVGAEAVSRALKVQSEERCTIGRALERLGVANESAVASALAAGLNIEYLEHDAATPDNDVLALLPEELCRRHLALPLSLEGNRVRVAMPDPANYSTLQDLEFRTGRRVIPVAVTESWFERMLAGAYPPKPRVTSYDLLQQVTASGEVEALKVTEYDLVDPAALAKDTQLPPVVGLVNKILSDAARAGASDVHIEPGETAVLVRERVDGLLRDALTIPRHLQDQTTSRIKIISGMDIAERRKPQDGRCRLRFEGRRIDLRVSTLPTQFGEKIVIRLLNSDRAVLGLEEIGLAGGTLALFRGFLAKPQGMILVTGPTGSGKTSTLYSALQEIKSSTTNIITLEDPIEFQVAGVNQTQVNPRAGVTFAAGLRSILRQDPNVILVGEIRDQETANIALEAAQTGHLLLSTLHTNDAPGTITRLLDLGVQPFLVASSLVGVLAQRLVRRPCAGCVAPHRPADDTVEKLRSRVTLPNDGQWVTGTGCEACGHSGFKGRLAVHELLQVNDEIRDLMTSGAAEHIIRRAARRAGMRTLAEDAVEKAARGLTTLEEVLRIVPMDVVDEGVIAPAPIPADETSAEPAAGQKRVLVVEDNPTVITVVKYFLELDGFEVIVAEDGRTGLQKALEIAPDVIVSDVRMPNMDGLEMVRELRRNPRTAGVRILMLTSEEGVEGETRGLEAGADDYIEKPVEPRRLAARIKALLSRGRPAAS